MNFPRLLRHGSAGKATKLIIGRFKTGECMPRVLFHLRLGLILAFVFSPCDHYKCKVKCLTNCHRCMEPPTVRKRVGLQWNRLRWFGAEWTISNCQNNFYGNVPTVGVVHSTRQRNNWKIRLLPTFQRIYIYPGVFSVNPWPLVPPWRRHDS